MDGLILKKLEIYGFKSFADKIHMSFDGGITSIVGPNGSGKSNIADAIRWVLGEQSARSLRGNKMEDVIFSGTQVRKPLGYAQVSITLDNSDFVLPLEYTEVTITRRVFRSGESEYSINKSPCRLKDITELLMDTGIGKEGYSIIGQGRIDEILSNRSEDRRYIFEEAAGIVKYKSRRNEAEKKLDKTQENLLRVEDIIQELEQQLEPLKEQSITAKKYLNLRDQLKHLEINLFLHQYERHSKKTESLKEQIDLLSDQINNNKADYKEKEKVRDVKALEINKIKEKIDALQQERYELINQIERIRGEQRLHQEKLSQIERDNNRLMDETEAENKELEERDIEINSLTLLIEEKKQALKLSEEDLNGLVQKLAELEADLKDKQDIVDKSKGNIVHVLNKISQDKESLTRYQTIKGNLDSRLAKIKEQVLEKENSKEKLNQELDSLHNNIMSTKAKVDEKESKKQDIMLEISTTKQTLGQMDNEIQLKRQEIEGLRSRHKLLEDMQKGYEGYNKSVKDILRACKSNQDMAKRVQGTLASLIDVPKKYELAIETVLGQSLQHIVTDQEEDAKYLIDYLKKNKLGRATFLPISSIRPRTLNKKEEGVLEYKGCHGLASEFIKCDKKYKDIVDNLLGRVIIADDLEEAIRMARDHSHTFRIVTLGGDLINPGGSMTGGSKAVKGISLLGRKRELNELTSKIKDETSKLKSILEKQDSLYKKHRQNKDLLEEIENSLREIVLDLTKSQEIYTNSLAQRNRLDLEIRDLNNEETSIKQDLQDLEKLISETTNSLSRLEEENTSISQGTKKLEDTIKELINERDIINSKLADSRVMLATAEGDIKAIDDEISRLNNEKKRKLESIKNKKALYEANIKEKDQLVARIKDYDKEIETANTKVLELEGQTKTQRDAYLEGEKLLLDLNNSIKSWNQTIEELTSKKHQFEVQLSRIEAELENFQNNIWNEYEITYNNALLFKDESLSYTRIRQDIQRLKTSINELGSVNVNAVEQYNRINERYSFLTSQRDDLIAAKEDLELVIKDITSSMEKRFRKEFATINKHFGDTFAELFGGGKAELLLEDEQDILSCGIEIIAQPPGKKLQSLSLLSGGEKALTAIAILFAILRHKPSPFCVLDEIDAALDESNVYQFSSFIQNLKDTQFIIITHRKGTMEASDVMYGIAMEEKGISKLVSVKFEDMVS